MGSVRSPTASTSDRDGFGLWPCHSRPGTSVMGTNSATELYRLKARWFLTASPGLTLPVEPLWRRCRHRAGRALGPGLAFHLAFPGEPFAGVVC